MTERPPRLRSRLGAAAFLMGSLIVAGTLVAIAVDDEPEAPDGPAPATSARAVPSGSTTTVVGRSLGPACGDGAAEATPIPPREPRGARYPTRVEVVSGVDGPIEINHLSVRVTFGDGTVEEVELHTTGVMVPPGESRLLSGPTIESESSPVRWETVLFVYEAEGRPECRVST